MVISAGAGMRRLPNTTRTSWPGWHIRTSSRWQPWPTTTTQQATPKTRSMRRCAPRLPPEKLAERLKCCAFSAAPSTCAAAFQKRRRVLLICGHGCAPRPRKPALWRRNLKRWRLFLPCPTAVPGLWPRLNFWCAAASCAFQQARPFSPWRMHAGQCCWPPSSPTVGSTGWRLPSSPIPVCGMTIPRLQPAPGRRWP